MVSLSKVARAPEALGPEGPFAAILKGFEWRRGQQEMCTAVAHVLEHRGTALIEAGTGTGKSLAYLVPAALFSVETDHQVVISTNTINLQEQLLHKDIPLLQRALGLSLRACLVKGWRNYVCLYRLHAVAQGGVLDLGYEDQAAAIADWVTTSVEGSLSEWRQPPAIWDEVCAESDTCLRSDCPFVARCFLWRARAQMDEAHLLLVNHHLLFADVAVRRATGWKCDAAVLPAYERVIVDEAHHIEHVATSFLSASLSEYALSRYIGRLYRQGHGQTRGAVSLLYGHANRCLAAGRDRECADQVLRHIEYTVLPGLERLQSSGRACFEAATAWLGSESVRRIKAAGRSEWQDRVGTLVEEFAGTAAALAGALEKLRQDGEPLLSDEPGLTRELEALVGRGRDFAALAEGMAEADSDSEVFWVDGAGRRGQVRVIAAPLQIGPLLREWMEHLSTLVCTSATLTVAKSYSYFRSSMGLQTEGGDDVGEVIIASPFDFPRQALLAVPRDLPEPTHTDYPRALAAAVEHLVRASRGRAFVLFTSYALLRYVASRLAALCEEEGWPLLVQGEHGRTQMLSTFRNGNSVLLGTDSFWEGVDVPGPALSCVILTRLPFRVPNEPVLEARMEALRDQGLDPFYNYALPEAVLRFKQGFGRLIRHRDDRGVVVVCDRRILQKGYGRYFLTSLPECTSRSGSLEQIAEAVSDWV
jgi:ATP-dependent DNA helicase DinG